MSLSASSAASRETSTLPYWTLARANVLGLTAAYLFLFLELRYDHNHVVRHHWIAWVPIIYSGLMVFAGLLAVARWENGGPAALFWLFAAGIIIGLTGYYQHNSDALLGSIGRMLSTWGGSHPDPTQRPPVLAPLSFAGLGVLGMLACKLQRR